MNCREATQCTRECDILSVNFTEIMLQSS